MPQYWNNSTTSNVIEKPPFLPFCFTWRIYNCLRCHWGVGPLHAAWCNSYMSIHKASNCSLLNLIHFIYFSFWEVVMIIYSIDSSLIHVNPIMVSLISKSASATSPLAEAKHKAAVVISLAVAVWVPWGWFSFRFREKTDGHGTSWNYSSFEKKTRTKREITCMSKQPRCKKTSTS